MCDRQYGNIVVVGNHDERHWVGAVADCSDLVQWALSLLSATLAMV